MNGPAPSGKGEGNRFTYNEASIPAPVILALAGRALFSYANRVNQTDPERGRGIAWLTAQVCGAAEELEQAS